MILPPEAVPPRVAAVVWAVVRGAGTYREVSAACGWRDAGGPFGPLRDARRLGLLDFEDRLAGTLRPTVEVVAFTPRHTDG